MTTTITKALKILSKLDPQANALLLPLEGKSLTIYFNDLNYTISLNIQNQNLVINNNNSINILSGKLAHIVELIFNKNLQELLIAKKINYEGNLKDLKDFYNFFNAIDIDIIYKISKTTNSGFANIVTKPFKKIKQYIKTSQQETIIDIRDYLVEEKQTLISQNEINIFYREIEKLRQAADRIEAKLKLSQGLT